MEKITTSITTRTKAKSFRNSQKPQYLQAFSPLPSLCFLCLCGQKNVHFRPFLAVFLIPLTSRPTTSTEILTVSFSSQILFNKVPSMKKKIRKIGIKERVEFHFLGAPASRRLGSINYQLFGV